MANQEKRLFMYDLTPSSLETLVMQNFFNLNILYPKLINKIQWWTFYQYSKKFI